MIAASEKDPIHPQATGGEGESKWPGQMADDVGNTYGPEPLATLTATSTELIISGTRGTFRVPRASVTGLCRGKMYPWFFSALRIKHTVASYPIDLQSKPEPGRWRDVLARLKVLGYPAD
jgi:hypothetical protein